MCHYCRLSPLALAPQLAFAARPRLPTTPHLQVVGHCSPNGSPDKLQRRLAVTKTSCCSTMLDELCGVRPYTQVPGCREGGAMPPHDGMQRLCVGVPT